ncbi:hypothetical protein HAX54_025544 [Datura stramonium]|uniref:Uncharacterized protein n=1 Tax=Datura stramonium TaxID=4076 RepID=A0ABS8S6A2_DATST|nr:hypothetical protein [Datura stramonium]
MYNSVSCLSDFTKGIEHSVMIKQNKDKITPFMINNKSKDKTHTQVSSSPFIAEGLRFSPAVTQLKIS